MDILNYYALIVFLLLCVFLTFKLNSLERANKLFSFCSIILVVTLIFNSFNDIKNDTLYSLLTFYIGLMLLLLGNYFTQSLGKKIGEMFTKVKFYNYRLRRKIGIISIVCGLFYIVLSFFSFDNNYVLYILVWTLIPMMGVLTGFVIIKYSNLKEV